MIASDRNSFKKKLMHPNAMIASELRWLKFELYLDITHYIL